MVSFALGLFIGFCLGILCIVLLFQAKASDAPTPPPQDEHAEPSYHVMNPSEAPSHQSGERRRID